jgi:flagella basal body P-ring formation protein FlgA
MHPVNESIRPLSRPVRASVHALALAVLGSAAAVQAEPATVHEWQTQLRQLTDQASAHMPAGTRVEVEVGTLDPRLKLAACARITPYLPTGARLWGRTQVGLRCVEGARWNVFLPVTVKVYAKAWTVNQPLALGAVLAAEHLQLDEVDIAAEPSPVVHQVQAAIGRSLARALRPGQVLREADLKARQWFAAGDTVRIVSVGSGFSISAEGQALAPGIDGQAIKVRTEGGRVITGRAVATRRVEVLL